MGMEKYVVDRRIGVGSYGSAYLVRLRADKQRCLVLKKIRLDNVGAKERRAAHAEAKLLQRFDHPFVLGYVDSFSHKGHLCIVTDYCEAGDLYCRLKSSKSYWREDAILDMFAQICLALDYVHDQKVLHRDLKTQNVFLHRNGTIKLGDFGIARQMDAPMDMAMTVIGTPYYMSPELMEGKAYGYKSDVWALGCVLYELATLKHAFDANDMNGLVMKIVRGRVLPVPMHYSPELRALICKLLSKRSADRPTVKRVLEMPVLAKHVVKHRAAVLARMQQVQVEKGAPPAAAAPAAGAASAAGGVVAKGRADARARLERDLASQREARARLEGNMNRLPERNRKHAPVGGSKAPAVGPTKASAAPSTPANLQDAIRRKERELAAISYERRHIVSSRRRIVEPKAAGAVVGGAKRQLSNVTNAAQREARARLEGNMNRLPERNRKHAPVGGSKAPAVGPTKASAAPSTPANLQDAIRRKERELAAISYERRHIVSSRRRIVEPKAAGAVVGGAKRQLSNVTNAGRAGEAPNRASSRIPPARAAGDAAARAPVRIIPVGAAQVAAGGQRASLEDQMAAHRERRRERARSSLSPQGSLHSGSDSDRSIGSGSGGALSDRHHGAAPAPSAHSDGSASGGVGELTEVSSAYVSSGDCEAGEGGGAASHRDNLMAARRRKKEAEAAAREAELLAARRSYFEERRAAHARNNSEHCASEGNYVAHSHGMRPAHAHARVHAHAQAQAQAQAHGGAQGPSPGGIDREAAEIEMVALQAQHAAVTQRIEELPERETLKAAQVAEGDASTGGAVGAAGSGDVLGSQHTPPPQANVKSLERLDTPAARELESEFDRKPGAGGGAQQRISLGDGMGAQRVQAVRQVCEHHLGAPLLSKLMAYMRERSRLMKDGEDVDDAAFRGELRAHLGAERMQYVSMVDQLMYLQDNHSHASHMHAHGGHGQHVVAVA